MNPNFLCPAIWPSRCRVSSCWHLRVTPSPCSLLTLHSPFCKEPLSRLWEFPFSAVCVYASSFQHGSCRFASNRGSGRNVSSVGCNPLWAVANHTPIHASILHNGACSCTLLGTSLIYIYIYIYIWETIHTQSESWVKTLPICNKLLFFKFGSIVNFKLWGSTARRKIRN